MSTDTDLGAGARAEVSPHVLDNAAWASLSGAHSVFAEHPSGSLRGAPRAARYDPGVSPFAALADPAGPRSWADLAVLVGPGRTAALSGLLTPPAGWKTVGSWRSGPRATHPPNTLNIPVVVRPRDRA